MAQNWDQIGRDLAQKYSDTFVRLKWDGEWEVVYVRAIIQGKPPVLVLYNSKFGELQLNYNTNFELSFEFPTIGYFLHDKKACLLVRRYHRQFRRGISAHTTLVTCPYEKFSSYAGLVIEEATLISAFSERKFTTLNEAVKQIEDHDLLSIPLTNELAVGLHPTHDSFLVWYLSVPVAEYFPGKSVIQLHEKVFTQEITDYFNEIKLYNVQFV